jgi:hypothetical protein
MTCKEVAARAAPKSLGGVHKLPALYFDPFLYNMALINNLQILTNHGACVRGFLLELEPGSTMLSHNILRDTNRTDVVYKVKDVLMFDRIAHCFVVQP